MAAKSSTFPTRVHVLGHANPSTKDFDRLGVRSARELLALIRNHLPAPLELTGNPAILEAPEDQNRGGRRDDAARIRDIQNALDDARTLAIVALNGGAYLSRIMPHLDFSSLKHRKTPLLATGFSEITSLVNIVASHPRGRGLYWLCPNYLGWKIKPAPAGRAAYADFWRRLPEVCTRYADWTPPNGAGRGMRAKNGAAWITPITPALPMTKIEGRVVHGKAHAGPIRVVGGCLSVLASLLGGEIGRRLRPDGRWLALEDVNEQPYRVDRYLAAFKIAGWFERAAGVLIGDFHTAEDRDEHRAVLEMLRFHLPANRDVPVISTRGFGHTWPMAPLPLNRPLHLQIRGKSATIAI